MANFYDIFEEATNKKKKKKNEADTIPAKTNVSKNTTKTTNTKAESGGEVNSSPLKQNMSPLKKEKTSTKSTQVKVFSPYENTLSVSRPTFMTPGEIKSSENIRRQQEGVKKARENAQAILGTNEPSGYFKSAKGNVAQQILGSTGDVFANLAKGELQTAEGLVDFGRYLYADIFDLFGADNYAAKVRRTAAQNTTGVIFGENDQWNNAKDDGWLKKMDEYSVFDNKMDSITQSVGQQAFRVGLSKAGGSAIGATPGSAAEKLLNNLQIFTGAYGSAKSQALASGADNKTATIRALISGTAEYISEHIDDGLPGFRTGGLTSPVKNTIAGSLNNFFGNELAGKVAVRVMGAMGEAFEERMSNALETLGTDVVNAILPDYTYGMEEGQGVSKDSSFRDKVAKIVSDTFKSATNEDAKSSADAAFWSTLITGAFADTMPAAQRQQAINAFAKDKGITKEAATKLFDEVRNARTQEVITDKTQIEENLDIKNRVTTDLARSVKKGNIDLVDYQNYFANKDIVMDAVSKGASSEGLNLVDSYRAYHGKDTKVTEISNIQQMMENRGINARFDATMFTNSGENAVWVTKDGKESVVFNPKASKDQVIENIATHEMTHDIVAQKTATGESLYDSVLEHIKKDANYAAERAEIENLYAKYYDRNSKDFAAKVDEEMVANSLGKNLGTQEYITRLVNDNATLAQKIYRWVVDKLQNYNTNRDASGKLLGYKSEKLYWEGVKNKFEKAYNEQKKATISNDTRMMIGDVINKNNYKKLKINEKYLDANKNIDYTKIPKNLVTAISLDEGKAKYLDYTTNTDFFDMDIDAMDTAIKLSSAEALLSQKAGFDTGVSNDYDNFYIFDIINKQSNAFSIRKVVPISSARGAVYDEIRRLSRRTGEDIDRVIRNYNKLEQKNNSMYSINVNNTRTNETNDRVFDREQRQQSNVEGGQTSSKSNEDTRFSLNKDAIRDLAKKIDYSPSMLEANLGETEYDVKRYLTKYTGIVDQYMKDNNIKVEPVMKSTGLENYSQEYKDFIKNNDINVKKLGTNENLLNQYMDLLRQEMLTRGTPENIVNGIIESERESYKLVDENYDIPFSLKRSENEFDLIRNDTLEITDEWETEKKIQKEVIDSPQFQKYLDNLISPLFHKESHTVDEVMEEAKYNHGTTDDYSTGAYMTTDGQLLNFNDHGYRDDHRTIDAFDLDMREFMDYGAIRMQPEGNGFQIAVEPTDAQYDRLEDYIDNYLKKNDDTIYVDVGKAGQTYKSTTPTSKIISDIQTYFRTGTYPKQSELAQFRYSLAPTEEIDIQDRINQSMTMDEARKMIDIAFKENQINDWRDDNEKYKNADEWLNDVGTDEVAMYVENGYSTIENYLNPLYDRDNSYGEDYMLEDIIEAYKKGTLTGGTKQQANRLDLTKTGNRLDTRFYSPQNIENIQEVYNIANERVNNNNRDDVYKARGQFVILAHNQENIDNLGLDRQELNKKLKNWAAYSNKALELSNRLNANVDRNNQWAGLENSSIINTASISNEELSSLVKSIEGDNSEWQRHYITSTMLALDTHINYKDLSFQFDQNAELSEKNALGDYSRSTKTIRIGRGYQNTVAHEMGHYLDNKWAEDFGFFSTANMTDNLNFKDANVSEDVKQFAKNFKIFMDDLVKGATSDSTSNVAYYQDRSEVFARFVGKFVEWVKNTASDGRFGYEDKYYKDNFTQNQYEEFVKLLQEKSMLDSTNQTDNMYSLTTQTDIAPVTKGTRTTMGELFDYNIAPIREDLSNIREQMNNLSNQIQTLQNGVETTSDNEIAPYNPYKERAIAQREANQRAEEMYKDENYWKSIEESANQVSDLDEKSAKKMSRNIGKELGLKQKQIKDLQNVIQKAFDEGYSLQDIKNELDMQFGHQRVSEKLDHVIEAQKELKNYKIKVSPTIQKDIADYGYWKQQYFGKIRFSNEGTPVDVAYAELSSRNPSMYPSDIINPTDQLLRIAEVADMDRKYTYDYEMDRNTIDEAANYINDTIQETLYSNAMKAQNDLEQNAMQYNERTQDIPIKKRTRQEVRENLQNTMGITVDDLQVGKDIGSMSYNLTTPERVNEKVFGREVGRKINEQTVFFAKHQEAERTRFLNRERQEIKDLGIKARSKESALVQQYGEGLLDDVQLAQAVSDKATQEKIKNAARVLRSKYDTYLDQINEELVEMGYDPIPKRKDYMRHFQELTDKFSQAGIPFNRQALNAENLPTDINGLTEFNVPGKNWFASAQRRTGEKTTYDAITGIDGYLEGASNLMYHTETIQRYRALEKLIRDTYGQQHGLDVFGDDLTSEQAIQRITDIQEGKLSNYAAWLKEQGNAIAGKKGALDRGAERLLGRRGYTLASELKKQVGSNMTGFNVRSALTNFISSTIAASKTNKLAMVKGTVDTIRNIFHDDGFINRSDFLTNRFGSDTLSKKTWQKISNAGQIFMSGSDWFTSNVITRSKYYEGIQKGMTDEQAMAYANDFAARVMGDRSKGATAEAFNSKTLGFLTQFQLETNNQWQFMIHDTKMEYQENMAKDGGLKAGATILFQVGQLAAYSYLFNEMFEQLTGSRAAFDILDIIKKLFGLDDDDKDKTFEERMKEAGSELVDALPFASLFGSGGRLPIGEMLTPAQTLYDYITGGTNKYGQDITLKDVGKDTLEAIPYYVLPTGYGQIKKTAKGLGMYDSDLPIPGSYTDSGNLRFTADTDTGSVIKNALFGQWAGQSAKDYRESGYKTIKANDIPLMKDLGMNSSEFRKFKEGMAADTSTSMDVDGVKYDKYFDNSGNMYWYNKDTKTVYDENMNKTDMNVMSLEKANASELKFDYVSNLPISEDNKMKLFNELFTNTTTDKYGYKKYTDSKNKTYWYDEDNDTLYNNKYNKVNKSSINGLTEVSESKNLSNYKDYGSYAEFDYAYKNPAKYKTMKAIAGYDDYQKYKAELTTIRDNTKEDKKETFKYINSLDLTIPQKAMFLRQYYSSYKKYNKEIVNYVANLDIDYEDKVEILKSLKFKVDKNGNVTWK